MDKIKKFEDFLDRMKGLLDNAKRQGHIIVRVEDLENTFQELKESEDERMRKLCEVLVRSCFVNELCTKEEKDDCIAWVEKQGEQKLDYCHHEVDLSNCSEEYRKAYYDGWNNCNMQHSQCQSESNDVVKCLINGMRFYHEDNEEAKWGTAKFSMKVKDILSWLEKQRGQKPTDKVESKFKVGDCVVDNCGYVWRIEGRLNEFYILEGIDGGESRPTIEWVNNTFHLWTIQDAKDGDVLAVDNMIFIYKRTLASHIVSYCKLINDIFEPFDDARTCCEGNPYVHPATKEQRDTLMKAMADAGYTFEFEKKELNKIEQNLDWGEEIEIGG